MNNHKESDAIDEGRKKIRNSLKFEWIPPLIFVYFSKKEKDRYLALSLSPHSSRSYIFHTFYIFFFFILQCRDRLRRVHEMSFVIYERTNTIWDTILKPLHFHVYPISHISFIPLLYWLPLFPPSPSLITFSFSSTLPFLTPPPSTILSLHISLSL